MAKKKLNIEKDTTTEDRIKASARAVFHRKGFAATRTRDIAEDAGINIALLNYYFRSKENLFQIIMLETMSRFLLMMSDFLNDEKSSLDKKVELVASNYIDFIMIEPDIPIFMLNEIRNNTESLLNKLPIKDIILNSAFFSQHRELVAKGKIKEPNPLHFLMNMLSLVVFPFIAQPLLKAISETDDKAFKELMQERKKLIPIWIKAMMKAG
ncbi:MAG: TetR/AcrR family transcriptional regulator [Saprospiraceae bacterium]|nr:TetR/AcrR family transcriptional regulator [Saprospiraceae bacterium]